MRRSSLWRRLLAVSGVAAVALGVAVAVPGVASAAPLILTVTTTSDSGTGSLRDAITLANANAPDGAVITVTATGTITLGSPLTVSAPVQLSAPSVGDVALTGSGTGLDFVAGSEGSQVSGLVLNGFASAITLDTSSVAVTGNWFGLAESSTLAGAQGGTAVQLFDNSTVQGNVFGNVNIGVQVVSLSGATVSGNLFGLDASGLAVLADPPPAQFLEYPVLVSSSIGAQVIQNTFAGTRGGVLSDSSSDLAVSDNSFGFTTGGAFVGNDVDGGGYAAVNLRNSSAAPVASATVTGNRISGTGWGVAVRDAGGFDGLTISGNTIGEPSGGNTSGGILIGEATTPVANGVVQNNQITANGGPGIRILDPSASVVTVLHNQISGNADLGIDVGVGGVNAPGTNGSGPHLSGISAGSGDVGFTFDGTSALANQDVTVDLYVSDTCDTSGYGEGQSPLTTWTVATDGNGDVAATTLTLVDNGITFSGGENVTATVVPVSGSGTTTEFSNCFAVPAGPVNHEPFTLGADPNPASVGLNQTVDVTLTGYDEDGDPLTFALPGGGTSINGSNSVTLLGSPSCDGNIPSTCTQVARFSASTPFLGSDVFTWTVDDGTATAPAASAQVDVINAGLRMTNVLWFDAGYVPGSSTSLQAFAVNDGPDTAHNTVMTVSAAGGGPLPAGVSLVSGNGINDAVNAGSCTETSGVITCPIGDLQSLGLAGVDLTLSTSVATPDPLVVEATISSDTPDAFSANNTYTSPGLPAVAAGTADLSVGTLVDTPDPVTAGGDVQYTTTITNNGPDAATGIQVKLNGDSPASLPSFTSFVSGTAGSASCASTSGGPVLCPVGTLASGDSVSVTIYLQSDLVSSLTTTPVQVSVTSSSTDPNGGNDAAGTTTTIDPVTGGDTTVYVPPSTEPQTVASGQTVVLRGDVIPVATTADPVGAAVTVPPDGPGGVVTIEEQACAAPFRCPGEPRTGTQPAGTLIAGTVTQIVPPDADFYDFSHPLTYTLTYDKTTFSPTSRIRVYYVKDGAPDVLVRARSCGPLSATTVFPCLKGVKILKSPDLDVRGDLRVRLLATWNDPKIGTYKG